MSMPCSTSDIGCALLAGHNHFSTIGICILSVHYYTVNMITSLSHHNNRHETQEIFKAHIGGIYIHNCHCCPCYNSICGKQGLKACINPWFLPIKVGSNDGLTQGIPAPGNVYRGYEVKSCIREHHTRGYGRPKGTQSMEMYDIKIKHCTLHLRLIILPGNYTRNAAKKARSRWVWCHAGQTPHMRKAVASPHTTAFSFFMGVWVYNKIPS